MIKLKYKMILVTTMLGFSGLSMAHVNQSDQTFAEGTVQAYCGDTSPLHSDNEGASMMAVPDLVDSISQSVYVGQGHIDVEESRSDYDPPAGKRPITIGLAIDEEGDLMPKLINGGACEVSDVCRLFVLPRT